MTEQEHSKDIADLTAEITRVKKAFQVACHQIAVLNDQRQALTDALTKALNLVDHLVTEMRVAQVVPSAGVIVTKASLDQAMHKLLKDQDDRDDRYDNGDVVADPDDEPKL